VESNNIDIIVLAIGLFALAYGVRYFLIKWLRSQAGSAVQRRSRILSNAERSFYDELCSALEDDYVVFPKMAMSDVIEPEPQLSNFAKPHLEEILDGERFDFVLASRMNMSVFGVVELEHSGAAKPAQEGREQKARNEKIAKLCEKAGVRVFYFDARQNYKNLDLSRLIIGRSKQSEEEARMSPTHQSQLTIDTPSHSIHGHSRSCPKCHSEIVTKVAVKGTDIGEKFLMCRKYPYCDYRVAIKDLERMREIEREENKKVSSGVYNKWS